MKILSFCTLVAASLVFSASCLAQAVSPVHDKNGISYVSGGVGQTERNTLKTMAHKFDLKLVFATTKGAYLANVGVKIKNSNGHTLIDTQSNGPWFFAKLAPGRYTVKASFSGTTLQREVSVEPGKMARAGFGWKVPAHILPAKA